jgi:hypothetical protein
MEKGEINNLQFVIREFRFLVVILTPFENKIAFNSNLVPPLNEPYLPDFLEDMQ